MKMSHFLRHFFDILAKMLKNPKKSTFFENPLYSKWFREASFYFLVKISKPQVLGILLYMKNNFGDCGAHCARGDPHFRGGAFA